MNLDFPISLFLVALSSILGGLSYFVLKRFRKYPKYALLAEMFLMILVVGELMKEGFAVTGFVMLSLLAGMGLIYLIDRITRIRKINTTLERKLLREIPKAIALGSSFAIDNSLGIAIAILLFLHNIPKGGLLSEKKSFKDLITIQFVFIVIGIITYIFLANFNILAQSLIMTFAAGMLLFIVIEEGLLLKS
ncbi:hypothetical protein GOV06_02190 [Candidatus Woesearchaeota archaeon]|nr:hypothetical protein [Candidatus Woesearchaeota archaeon]